MSTPTNRPEATRVLVLGVSGMSGHLVATYLAERGYLVSGVSRQPQSLIGVTIRAADLADQHAIHALAEAGPYDVIVNCLGVLPKEAEADPARAVLLNAYLPQYLAQAFKDSATRVIHVSTDCVFSGREGGYAEGAFRDGETIYDRTKALGEFVSAKDLILRQSYVGPEIRDHGTGLLHWFLGQRGQIGGYENAVWNGVTTLALAAGIATAIDEGTTGLYHLVSPAPVSKYELLQLFNDTFDPGVTIRRTALPHRVDKSLVNSRRDLGFTVPPLADQVRALRGWMEAHSDLYGHYRHMGAPSAAARRG